MTADFYKATMKNKIHWNDIIKKITPNLELDNTQ